MQKLQTHIDDLLNLNKILHSKAIATQAQEEVDKNESNRKELYANFDIQDSNSIVNDDMKTQINEYLALIKNFNYTNGLDFGRVHRHSKKGLVNWPRNFSFNLHHLLNLK